jgi:hypothetical protein
VKIWKGKHNFIERFFNKSGREELKLAKAKENKDSN